MNDGSTRSGGAVRSIASMFEEMTDQRKPKGVRYGFRSLLILLSLAKLCSQDTPSEITDWVAARGAWLRKKLGLGWKRMPSITTWQRFVASNIDASEFDRRVCLHLQSLSPPLRRELLNLDGKSACRTIDRKTEKRLHLVALQESGSNRVVEQTALTGEENEISGAKRLLGRAPLAGKTVSGDALFAQKELSRVVVGKGGEYLWKLRANQPGMHEMAKRYFESGGDRYVGRHGSLEKGHGRIDEREIVTSFRLAHMIEFPHLEQVFRIRHKSTEVKTGRHSERTIYGITSLPVGEFGAKELMELTRRHWSIENGLHYRRDVTFKEDRIRQTSRTGGHVLAVLNNLTIAILRHLGWENIAKARRHFSTAIGEALNLLLLPLKPLL